MNKSIKKGLSWGLYDFANSGYFLVYVVLTFPLFLSRHRFETDRWFEAKWGMAQGVAIVLAVLLGRIAGRRLDRVGVATVAPWCMRLAGASSLTLPILVGLDSGGSLLLGAFAVVHAVYLFSLTVYDASLKQVTSGLESVEVSGWAWGWGYVGGIVCMISMMIVAKAAGESPTYSFLTASLFYFAFSMLAARGLSKRLGELKVHSAQHSEQSSDSEDSSLMAPTSRWRLLLTFVLIVDGIAIFMGFFSVYANKVADAPEATITTMLGVLQLLAFPLTGLLSTTGTRRLRLLLVGCGLAWAVAATLVVAVPTVGMLWACVFLMAGAVGTTQALLRSLYADTVPPDSSIHGFSTYAVVEKGAAFLGPLVGGSIISLVGHKPVMVGAGLMILAGTVGVARLVRVSSSRAPTTRD